MTDEERKEKEIDYLLNGPAIIDRFWDNFGLIFAELKDEQK